MVVNIGHWLKAIEVGDNWQLLNFDVFPNIVITLNASSVQTGNTNAYVKSGL